MLAYDQTFPAGTVKKKTTFWNNLFLFQIVLMVSFSSRTTSMDIQRNLEANVEKRTKDTYGPPMGKRLLVFMDDMNMPKVGGVNGGGGAVCCVCGRVCAWSG